jgi:hypothetical protein
MLVQSREVRVLTALLVSITAGKIILMALGNNPPPAGAFSLSHYYSLDPIEKVILSRSNQSPDRWSCIEIHYSGTKAGNIEQLASLSGLASPEDINCHFVICNGIGGDDGQVQPTEKWQRQWSSIPDRTWYGNGQTIRICIIANGKTAPPTDFQTKRAEMLVEVLHRKFNVQPECIYYPNDWWQRQGPIKTHQ